MDFSASLNRLTGGSTTGGLLPTHYRSYFSFSLLFILSLFISLFLFFPSLVLFPRALSAQQAEKGKTFWLLAGPVVESKAIAL